MLVRFRSSGTTNPKGERGKPSSLARAFGLVFLLLLAIAPLAAQPLTGYGPMERFLHDDTRAVSGRFLDRDGAKQAYIVPSGIPGALVLCGSGEVSDGAIDRFVEWAGGEKGQAVILTAGRMDEALKKRLETRAKEKKGPGVRVVKIDDAAGASARRRASG